MDNFDKPLSEVFDLTRHPGLHRTCVAIAFNVTSIAVFGLFIFEQFYMPITGVVEVIDKLQTYVFNGYYLVFTSVILATLVVIVPLFALFKSYEWLTGAWLK